MTNPARLLLGICLATAPFALRAADKPVAPAPAATATTAAPAPGKEPEVLVLPKMEVTASRIKELDKQIKRLDKQIAHEKKKIKPTELDKALNNAALAKAGAIFGGNSAEYMAEVAATRVRYLETERGLLSDMREPQTTDDLALIEKTLEQVRTMRRELDNPGR